MIQAPRHETSHCFLVCAEVPVSISGKQMHRCQSQCHRTRVLGCPLPWVGLGSSNEIPCHKLSCPYLSLPPSPLCRMKRQRTETNRGGTFEVTVTSTPNETRAERRWVLLKIPRCDIDGVGEGHETATQESRLECSSRPGCLAGCLVFDLGMAREKGEAFVRWLSANSCNHARVVPTHLGADRGWCAFADSTCVRWWHGRK